MRTLSYSHTWGGKVLSVCLYEDWVHIIILACTLQSYWERTLKRQKHTGYPDHWLLPLPRWHRWWWSSAGWGQGTVPSSEQSVCQWRPSAPPHSATCPTDTHHDTCILIKSFHLEFTIGALEQSDRPVSIVACLDPVLPPPWLSGPCR